jgi:hypothetical protein
MRCTGNTLDTAAIAHSYRISRTSSCRSLLQTHAPLAMNASTAQTTALVCLQFQLVNSPEDFEDDNP